MLSALCVQGVLSFGTQQILKSTPCFSRYKTFEGLVVQCTLLKRPPEGGRQLNASDPGSGLVSDQYYWATAQECDLIAAGKSRLLKDQGVTCCTRPLEPITRIVGVIRSVCGLCRANKSNKSITVSIQTSGCVEAWILLHSKDELKLYRPLHLARTLDNNNTHQNSSRFNIGVLQPGLSSTTRYLPMSQTIATSCHYTGITGNDILQNILPLQSSKQQGLGVLHRYKVAVADGSCIENGNGTAKTQPAFIKTKVILLGRV